MIVNTTDAIKPESGRYILLADAGVEGLVVVSQCYSLEQCIEAMSVSPWSRHAIVQLMEFRAQ